MQLKVGVPSCVGNTPLIELTRFLGPAPFRLFAKLEMLNPAGSMKDRPAFRIIGESLERGLIDRGTTVFESSSGNMGVALAQACRYFGLKFVCVVDPKTTRQNVRLMEAYGATIDLISRPDPESGEFLKARLDRVKELAARTENSYWPNQYANPLNPAAHRATMHEIVTELGGRLDYLFCPTSTCGTLRGCTEYAREHDLPVKIIAVDALGSAIFGGAKCKRLVPGHGAAVVPALFSEELVHGHVLVSDLDCVVGCRRLARTEAILGGGSAGATLIAVERLRETIEPGSFCAAILPDRGERYLDTIYSDEWLKEHFGDISDRPEDSTEVTVCTTMMF